jgi:hypothetical protein
VTERVDRHLPGARVHAAAVDLAPGLAPADVEVAVGRGA